ncbi:hypothetical protein [Nitrobacter winogradskyi]|uniref:Uncharacterized protein n=2 Tax=Nitrobacter winogradskyi TaxID=913 RepID=A0ACC6AIK5_NITWI|nr:hypothetical protein [Nitrobacter winogradskyi]MCP1999583.1 hypothetical protein [Nitrobacter winogradskyi]GEC17310.1 hypothetical protein NWI01_32020 [Nitrobacter winogradskyi]
MSKTQLDESFASLLEELAALEHQRWAHWQKYVHDSGQRQPDGSILLPAEIVSRWEKQINTPYVDLSDEEKDSDREQVRKYLPLLERWLNRTLSKSGDDA